MPDFMSALGSNLAHSVMSSPKLQAVVLAIAVKVIVDQLKQFFAKEDATGLPAAFKVPVHVMVLVASFIATAGTLALDGKLSTLDVQSAVQFIATLIQTHLLATGAHEAVKAVKAAKAAAANPTPKPQA